jgi:glycine/sarcosine N-methyltransferase
MQMYDSLSADYDRFVNWPERLAAEMPFIDAKIRMAAPSGRPTRVLDAACGTGMHAIELARMGYETSGADLSARMIDRAIENAQQAGVEVDFAVAGFGELARSFSGFDALLCLGNSLPHVSDKEALLSALRDFSGCLRPGGLLLIQNRNFDLVLERGERWMSPEAYRMGEREWLFVRFYDFDQDGLITFNMITLKREGGSSWEQKVGSTRLYPITVKELIDALVTVGFNQIETYGSMSEASFDPKSSGNLVIGALSTGE